MMVKPSNTAITYAAVLRPSRSETKIQRKIFSLQMKQEVLKRVFIKKERNSLWNFTS